MNGPTRNRVEVMHGANLDQLERRDPAQYGELSFAGLERQIAEQARGQLLRR